MNKITKVLATGRTRTTSSDGRLLAGHHDGKVSINTSAGGPGAREHAFEAVLPHPTAEQLFAGAWSACYLAAVSVVAKEKKITLPPDTAVEIDVDLGTAGAEYLIRARLNLVLPGFDPDAAATIAHAADQLCPYSKATRGNIDVALGVITT
ncbi:Ohr family peroxiredoxin [Massilia niastensis]|uniref:Ohr family peroxiredoxin n=1 Tax=Massilia niastensis TaxID=544911 RepID=UPI00038277A5|nr:Ohr family peroxiredoxin [Massilia niastensis]